MTPSIFFKEGEKLVPLKQSEYEKESILQELLATFPELLVDTDSESGAYVHVGSELPFDGAGPEGGPGFIDHVFVSDLAVPTLIEVKRSSDPRIRREVVGQMLDYAASVKGQWTPGYLRGQYENLHVEPAERLRESIPSLEDVDDFWARVDDNIDAGNFRILFVADRVPDSLRRIIEFLNGQMDRTEVLAVEVKQFVDTDGKRQALVPSVVGQTQASREVKKQSRIQWDHDSFFAKLASSVAEDVVAVGARLFEWAETRGDLSIQWGRGSTNGSMQIGRWDPYLWPMNVYTSGYIEFSFGGMKKRPPFDSLELREELYGRLNAIDGVDLAPDRIGAYPSARLEVFKDEQSLLALIEAMEWAFSFGN